MNKEWTRTSLQIFSIKMAIFIAGLLMTKNVSVNIWYQWDALRCLAIAETGYKAENIVFYPLFPAFIRAAGMVLGDFRLGGLIVCQVLSFAGLLVFYALARLEVGPQRARVSLWALMLFPTAYFFHIPYTEGLFLLCAAASFYAARTGRWGLAGVLGGLAMLTRVTGLVLIPALAVEFYLQRCERELAWRKAAPLLLIPVACGLYLLLSKMVSGDYFAFLKFQSTFWNRHLTWPWWGLWRTTQVILRGHVGGYWWNVGVMELSAALVMILGTVWTFKKDRLSYGVYMLGITLLCLSNSFILCTPRYVLAAFPLFFLHRQINKRSPLVLGAAVAMAGLMGVYLYRYLMGWWAF